MSPAFALLLLWTTLGNPATCGFCGDVDTLQVTPTSIGTPESLALALGGAAGAFLAHEAGHLLANLAYHNSPQVVGFTVLGFVPFFAISPRLDCKAASCTTAAKTPFAGGRRGNYFITTAGFNVGHLTSEIILTTEPCLRYRQAPFRTGWLAFNLALSIGYAATSISGLQVDYGDAGGSSELAGLPPAAFAAFLLVPAMLDIYRFVSPGSTWVPWLSRVSKGAMVGLAFTF